MVALATTADETPEAVLLHDTRLDALDGGELATNLRAVISCSYRVLQPKIGRTPSHRHWTWPNTASETFDGCSGSWNTS